MGNVVGCSYSWDGLVLGVCLEAVYTFASYPVVLILSILYLLSRRLISPCLGGQGIKNPGWL